MTDIETMIKALRLARIPRLVRERHPNWKFVPDYFFKKYRGPLFSPIMYLRHKGL